MFFWIINSTTKEIIRSQHKARVRRFADSESAIVLKHEAAFKGCPAGYQLITL